MKNSLFACLFLFCCLRGVARNYYVSAMGNDRWEGNRAHPWKTLKAVNGFAFASGDSLFFHGGEHFRGVLKLEKLQGLFVGAYGTGPATIDAGDSSAIVMYRCVEVRVSGLRLVGSGRKTGNRKDGLRMIECSHCLVDDLDITGFQKSGLFIWSSEDIEASRILAHENGSAGISVEGADKRSSRDIRILYCRAEDNPGDPTNLTNHSGNGIVVGHCTNVAIERCSATNNGWDMPRIGNGPVGIWCYEADSVFIRYCLSYKNKTSPGAADGGGFDLDGGVTHSVIEHCLSYGNQGAGYCLFQYWGASPWHDNVIRDNISEDDGLVSDGRGGIYIWNSSGDATQLRDCQIYNNTVYNRHEAAISYSEKSERMGFVFSNNIFVGQDSLIRGDRRPRDGFRNNGWWLLKGQDRGPADAMERGTALFADPRFRDAGNTELTDVRGLEGYTKYQVLAGSPMSGMGAGAFGAASLGTEAFGTAGTEAPASFLDEQGLAINAHGAGILFYQGVYYLFGEIKKGPTRLVPGQSWEDYRVEAGGVSCYSSRDLRHWKKEGVALKPEPRDTASEIFTGRVIERPKVIYNRDTKKFVMWMHIDREDYGTARVGVAVSDRPQGPYRYLRSYRPNGQESRDMTAFQDEDGRAWLVYSSENNNTMQVCLLSKDYLSPTTTYKRILIGQRREAPAVFRQGGKYYLITSLCSGWDPNPARWAVADSMLGEWTQQGNPCMGPDSATTFHSQSTFVLKTGPDRYLFMADRWNKTDLERSTYLWLPARVEAGRVVIEDPAREEDKEFRMVSKEKELRREQVRPLALVSYSMRIGKPDSLSWSFIRFYDGKDRLLLEYKNHGGDYTEAPPATAYLAVGVGCAGSNVLPKVDSVQVTVDVGEKRKPHAPLCDLRQYLRPFWKGDTVFNETVLLVGSDGSGAGGRLLYRPDKLLSVRNYGLDTLYREGVDYVLKGDSIVRLAGSSMAFRADSSFDRKQDLAWYNLQSQWIVVSYVHHDRWNGPAPVSAGDRLPRSMARLRSGRPLVVVGYGMSITRGMNVSGYDGVAPYMPTYMDLFAQGLRWRYPRADVRMYNAGLPGSTVEWGASHADAYVGVLHPDLVVVDFGMNDFWRLEPGALVLAEADLERFGLRLVVKCCQRFRGMARSMRVLGQVL